MNIVNALFNKLGKDIVLTGAESVRPFECDGLSMYRQKPLAVVLVEDIAQIKTVLALCKQFKTSVVTRGAGTGLSGGALPIKNSVVLSLTKLNKIKSIDVNNKIAILEPGVTNLAISEAVSKYNLYYAPDPSSQIACSIGGNVAENSGGVHCLKYGLTVHNVAQVKIVSIDGKELVFSDNDKGLGLLALMHGSEGLLGVIVEISVKLLAKPQATEVIMAGFEQVKDCANAVADIIKAGIIPAGLEMMDKFAIKAAEDFVKVGYPTDVEALLLCELDGNKQQVAQEMATVQKILTKAKHIHLAQNKAQRLAFWKGRKAAFPAVGRLAPDYYCMDGTIARRYLAEVLTNISALSKRYGLSVANVFHAGDGNLHPLILYDANKSGEVEQAEAFGNDILKLCIDKGGSISGEHGVGVEKLSAMCEQFNTKELEIFHGIKAIFDPDNLLNPGKAVPTLHRCAELGQMHVHKGRLPFAELERF